MQSKKYKLRLGTLHGVSVLEMLIVIAAIVITVMISIPSSAMLMEKYRVKATYSELLYGLELAVSEAQTRSITVRLCPSSNGHTCRTDGDWNHGWLVFSDGNNNGTVQDIELIQAFKAPYEQVSIVARGAVETAASFTATGLIENGAVQTGLFNVCIQDSNSPPKVLTVSEEGWVDLGQAYDQGCESG